jgi:hypothetical protein
MALGEREDRLGLESRRRIDSNDGELVRIVGIAGWIKR